MSNLSTLPKGDSAWLLRKAIERIIQQVSVLETNIGASTSGNSANTQIIFNDNGTLRGDAGLVYNKTTDALTVGGNVQAASATITGDLTVATNRLIVNSVGVSTGGSPAGNFGFSTFGKTGGFYANKNAANQYLAFQMKNSTQDYAMFIDQDGIGSNSWSIFDNTNAHTAMRYYPGVGGSWIHYINGTTAMTLNSAGLLVGTVNNFASSRLCVQGTAGTTTPDVTIGIPVNSGGNTGLAIGRSASTNGYIFLDAYKAAVGGTELVLNSINGGSVLIGLSTVVAAGGCLQLKSGITFPATQVASSDANTLDDYEEGSWVPTLNSGTFSAASCRYTKVGNMVTIFFDVTVGTGGGDRITNLPFAAASTSTVANGIYTNAQTYAAGTTAPVVVVGGSSSTLFFRTVGSGVAFSTMTLTAAANLTGSISYFV